MDGKYLENCWPLRKDLLLVEKAMTHFCLSFVYNEIGKLKKSADEENQAVKILKKVYGENVEMNYINKIKGFSKNGLNFYLKTNSE